MASHETNDLVQAKLSGTYGTATVEIPFQLFEHFIHSAALYLKEQGLTKNENDLMNNPKVVEIFEKLLEQSANDVFNHARFYSVQYDMFNVYRNEIKAAEVRREQELEERIQALTSNHTAIPVNAEDYEKALTILKAAGMVNEQLLETKSELNHLKNSDDECDIDGDHEEVKFPVTISK